MKPQQAFNPQPMSYQWKYQAGHTWVPFDPQSNDAIEQLWLSNRDASLYIPCLRCMAYVYPASLTFMLRNGTRILIRRDIA